MRIRTLRVSPPVCFARLIRLEVEAGIKRAAEAQQLNSDSAIQLYQELLLARRARARHEDSCPICERQNRKQHGPKPARVYPGLSARVS